MTLHPRRRLYIRKQCEDRQTTVVTPNLEKKARFQEISIGGAALCWEEPLTESIIPGTRVRFDLPTNFPQRNVIIGGTMVWSNSTHCGIKILYTNCSTLEFQKVLDPLQ